MMSNGIFVSLSPPPTFFLRLGGGDAYSVNAPVRSFGLLHIIDEDKVYAFYRNPNWSNSTQVQLELLYPYSIDGDRTQILYLMHDAFLTSGPHPDTKDVDLEPIMLHYMAQGTGHTGLLGLSRFLNTEQV